MVTLHRRANDANSRVVGDAKRRDDEVAYPDGEESLHAGFTRLTMPFNATGQPALAVPCGFDTAGLQIGVQFVGAPGGEAELARIRYASERTAG